MNADGGMVAIGLLIILTAFAVLGFAVDQYVVKPRSARAAAVDYRPPATPLAEWVLKAHLDVQALDQAVLTGTVTDMDIAYKQAGYSVTRLAQQMLREMKQEENPS